MKNILIKLKDNAPNKIISKVGTFRKGVTHSIDEKYFDSSVMEKVVATTNKKAKAIPKEEIIKEEAIKEEVIKEEIESEQSKELGKMIEEEEVEEASKESLPKTLIGNID